MQENRTSINDDCVIKVSRVLKIEQSCNTIYIAGKKRLVDWSNVNYIELQFTLL